MLQGYCQRALITQAISEGKEEGSRSVIEWLSILLAEYKQNTGTEEEKAQRAYRLVREGATIEEATKATGISRAIYYRRLRTMRELPK